MAENQEVKSGMEKLAEKVEEQEQEEGKIPVFTVLKNNSILKNIFLIDSPPPGPSSSSSFASSNLVENESLVADKQELEEILVVGRHPDCNITLEHPSISRFHLRIHSLPSKQYLSVIDLSSVHGTWVCGKKIAPGVQVELHDGDILQLGGSSRIYRLHWIPLSHAYDYDNPFVPMVKEPERVEEKEDTHQDAEGLALQHDDQIQMEVDDFLFIDKNIMSETKLLTPSAPPMPEDMKSPLSYEEEAENMPPLVYSKSTELQPDCEQDEEGISLQHDEKIDFDDLDGLDLLFSDMLVVSEKTSFTTSSSVKNENIESPLSQRDDQIQMEDDELLFFDKNIMSETKELATSASPMPEDMKSPLSREEEVENKLHLDDSKSTKLQPDLVQEEEGMSHQHDERQTEFNNLDGLDLFFSDMFVVSERTSSSLMHENMESPLSQRDDQIQMEAGDLLFTDKSIMSETKQLTPSAPPMLEDMKSPLSHEEEVENKPPLDYLKSTQLQPDLVQDEEGISRQHDERQTEFNDLDGLDLLFSDMLVSEKTSFTTSSSLVDMESPLSCGEETENKSSIYLSEIAGLQPFWQFHRENYIQDVASGKSQHESPENSTLRPQLSSDMSIWKRRGKSTSVSVRVQTSRAGENSNNTCVDSEVKSESHENLSIDLVPEDPFASEGTAKEVFTPDKENCTPNSLLNRSLEKFGQEKRKHELRGRSIISCVDEDTEEAFTPDKENLTPNTLLLRSLKKLEKLDDIRCPKTYRSPLKNASSGVHQEVDKLGSSSKENHVRKLLQEKKPGRSASRSHPWSDAEVTVLKGKADRVPFQPLLASPNDTSPETIKSKSVIKSCSPINNRHIKESIHPVHNPRKTPKEENKKWIMVVDAACLLNKESRKALQLMEGLQGTSLIIPRIVIRELDCMKRRGNLFRRKTEVCSALEWIEACMVNAQSWIHVQNSMEDVRSIATTPPPASASPLSLFSQDLEKTQKFSIGSVPFSPCGSCLDIVSPTTEDHILECALFFRRIKNNRQLVLLSNDVTLKIKAMAEGLLCETSEEFRQSLVNPFSERFLWTDSSPRGPTWSCVDDVVLKEKYYNNPPIQKQSKSGEGAKGLKLILLHNSHFRQISSVR